MDFFLHLANVIYLIAYLVSDVLWLRVLTVVGGAFSLAWTLLQPEARFSWIAWTLVYNVINVGQIARLFYERRPVRLTGEEQQLYSLVFRTLTPREFKRLLALGGWTDAEAGTCLIQAGQRLDRLMALVSGSVEVRAGDRVITRLEPGCLVGEMSFLTGGPTTASVEVTERARFVCWDRAPLERFLGKNVELRAALQMVIGRDLVAKLSPGGGTAWNASGSS